MKTTSKWLTLDCHIIKQSDGPEIAVLPIDAYLLRDIATVSRLADQNQGYQRIINPRKLGAIKRYVEAPGAVLPTSIVLASGEKRGLIKVEQKKLVAGSDRIWTAKLLIRRDAKYKPFLVIDGQHRLFGIVMSNVAPYPVPVTILLGASKLVQMANFQIINNRATRIAAAHLNELQSVMYDLSVDDKDRLDRLLGQLGIASLSSKALVSELNGQGMVFEGILDYPSNGKSGFVSSHSLVKSAERSRAKGGFLSYLEDENDHLTAYGSMWQGLANKFSSRWKVEVELFKKSVKGDIKKSKAKKELRLLHSGSLSVLGQIADKELASSSYREKWVDDPRQIASLVNNSIFVRVPVTFWDDPHLNVDNTSKGRDALRIKIESAMVGKSGA